MLRRSLSVVLASLALVVLLGCGDGGPKTPANTETPPGALGGPLYPVAPARKLVEANEATAGRIVIEGARIVVIDKQDVPSLRDGSVLKVLVREGEMVKEDQVLVQLDDRLAVADVNIKDSKLESAKADHGASVKTRDEAYNRWQTLIRLWMNKAAPLEDVRAAQLTYDRYVAEVDSKTQAIRLADQELKQAVVVREMHKIRSTASGVVKVVYKKPGESVKNLEPVLQIVNIDRLRVEALADEQVGRKLSRSLAEKMDRSLPGIGAGSLSATLSPSSGGLMLAATAAFAERTRGVEVIVEPNITEGPTDEPFRGHLQEVTCVAVGSNGLIVSGSEDATVRLWKRGQEKEVAILEHPMAVRAIACTPKGSVENLCLTGCLDGIGRLWNLNRLDAPPRKLQNLHRGPITCVAFTPDGKSCATGGDDSQIRVWNTATGELRYKLPAGHRGAITSLAFTPQGLLVSSGRDNTLRRWFVHENGAEEKKAIDRRSGDIAGLGVSPDGAHMLYDQGKSLRLLSVEDARFVGEVRNASGSANFTTFAGFSPDNQLLLTTGASEGQLQLWRAPAENRRGYELRQFAVADHSPATCAAFASDFTPEQRFVVTGHKDRRVYVWPVPPPSEYDPAQDAEGFRKHREHLTGQISYVESESTPGHQVRVWVEVNNQMRLLPGGTATLVIAPR